ncbi:hypothetical protein [Sphaerisporangium perillae]|uniref:hypothetical protein n=1 Tax=Sphaerisporangium perillae TaxID=2935860 RepID=UPI00200F3E46|nr:hypothetical protein [Sphaerisporangium perillae]
MPDERLSFPQVAALLALMREAGEVSNPDLQERYGLKVDGENRRKLNALRLVDSRKQGRAYVHVLTDAGWARLRDELRAGVKRQPGSAGAALHAVLGGLWDFMDRTDHRLADIFTPACAPEPVASPARPAEPVASPVSSRASAPPAASSSAVHDIEGRIRAAYAELADKPGTWVGVTKVRSLLSDLPRGEVDAAFRRLNDEPDVTFIPEANQKGLSQRDRDAAVTIGDQDKHLIWIGA